MQTRHRIPTIFSIYMVDVLCCALGCVVLMWQYNLNEAEEENAAKVAALESLDRSSGQNKTLEELLAEARRRNTSLEKDKRSSALMLDELTNDNRSLKQKLEDKDRKLADKERKYILLTADFNKAIKDRDQFEKDRDRFEKLTLVYKSDFDAAKKAETELARLLAVLGAEHKMLLARNDNLKKNHDADLAQLARNLAANQKLNEKIKQAAQQLANLQAELEKSKIAAKAAGVKAAEQNVTLQDAVLRAAKLQAQVEQMHKDAKEQKVRSELLAQENTRLSGELAQAKKSIQEANLALLLNGKNLDEARALIGKLSKDNRASLEKLRVLTGDAKSRFAGITLTGTRVVFLVDMSGSMELVDSSPDGLDPDKWPLVCENVGKVMLSLPDLKQFQVVLFSDEEHDKKKKPRPAAWYPLGKDGQWLDFQGAKSVKQTVDTLKAIKPAGGTNMHAGFHEVFKFRPQGLDTVYFFSDGLPNSGEGLPKNSSNLSEQQVTDVLSKHIRKTMKTVWNNRPTKNSPRVRINTIGFFYESPEVGAFLWALARENDGSFVGMSKP